LAVSFFFNETPPTEIYTLSLHDALPIYRVSRARGTACRQRRRQIQRPFGSAAAFRRAERRHVPDAAARRGRLRGRFARQLGRTLDRKSTRLNSSHVKISYAVFCLKKKKE